MSLSDASEPDWMVARTAKKQQKDIDAVTDLTSQYETEFDQSSLQQYGKFSVFTEALAGPKSVFTQCQHKIDVISLYDSTELKDKTRFGKLPTKLEKANRPVTFNRQIKSSGYSSAPTALKYSTKEKQKIASKLAEPVFEVSRDFFGKPFPMTIPAEVNVLQQTKLNKTAVTRLAYSFSGKYLAAASVDTTISLIRTPVINNQLEYHSL